MAHDIEESRTSRIVRDWTTMSNQEKLESYLGNILTTATLINAGLGEIYKEEIIPLGTTVHNLDCRLERQLDNLFLVSLGILIVLARHVIHHWH